jgi:hypothetical protein
MRQQQQLLQQCGHRIWKMLPSGYSRVEIAQMQDAIWGLVGFDT